MANIWLSHELLSCFIVKLSFLPLSVTMTFKLGGRLLHTICRPFIFVICGTVSKKSMMNGKVKVETSCLMAKFNLSTLKTDLDL